jgi:Tfp pilus assembly protein PilO
MKKDNLAVLFMIVAIIGFIVADRLFISKFEVKFKELEQKRIVTTNKLTTAKIVSENLNHVRDLIFENMDMPGKKEEKTQETIFFAFVTTCINDLKLKLMSVKPVAPVSAGRITIYAYDIVVQGDFFKFGELCSKFENNRRIISLKTFHVEIKDNTPASNMFAGPELRNPKGKFGKDKISADESNKVIEISMRVETYRVKRSVQIERPEADE